LSEEKTAITHIDKGFDFLGQNVRKYNGAYSALFDHGLASKSDQRFASIRSTGACLRFCVNAFSQK
ncbi:hypothetical protein FQZ90_25405, partial [Escherichia coli]|nr:hypothetical protein [Escherichia coli]